MIDHVSITVSDLARAARFYDAVMAALGHPCTRRDALGVGYGTRNRPGDDLNGYMSVVLAADEAPLPDRRHWAFRAPSRAAVDAFHAAALANGGADDGVAGLRPAYHPHYYAAFVRDPDGNRIEAVCHRAED